MHVTYRQTCRVCGSTHLVPVIDLGEQHLQGSFLKDGYPPPPLRLLPTRLVRCDVTQNEKACGLLQMAHTMPPEILYANYWYTSGTNATMREHLKGIAEEAAALAGPGPHRVLDIGCNDGTLLLSYPSDYALFGVDPSDIAGKLDKRISLVNALFPSPALDAALAGETLDIVTSIAMFYDLEDPLAFTRAIKRVLAPEGLWVVEMSYLPLMLRRNSFDTICHEHLEYYSLAVLEYIMRATGLRVFRAELNGINGGSIRCYVCHDDYFGHDTAESRAALRRLRVREFEIELDTDHPYQAFQHRIIGLKSAMSRLLNRIAAEGKSVHIYGASTKGNVLLQWYGLDHRLIACAADRNPAKSGARTIGSNIPIVDEPTSRAMKPDYYLVLPWHFKKEFLAREKATIEAGTSMIFPLPEIAVVSTENFDEEMRKAEAEDATWMDMVDNPAFRDEVFRLL